MAVEAAGRQLDVAERFRDEELASLAQNLLAMAAWAKGDPDAGSHHRSAIEHAERAHDPWTLALVTAIAGRTAHEVGDHTAGAALLLDATELAQGLGEPMVLGSALDYRAHAELAMGHPSEAAALAARSLAAYSTIGYQEGLASAGTLAAVLAVLAGRYDKPGPCWTKPSKCVGVCGTPAASRPSSRRELCSTTREGTPRRRSRTCPRRGASGVAPARRPTRCSAGSCTRLNAPEHRGSGVAEHTQVLDRIGQPLENDA